MGRKPSTLLSNLATTSSLNSLKWENAKHACLDRKNLMSPPLQADTMHDLQCWSENEVKITGRQMMKLPEPSNMSLKDGESSTINITCMRTRYPLAK